MLGTFTGTFKAGRIKSQNIVATSATLVLELDANGYSGSGDWQDSTVNNNDAALQGTPTWNSANGGYFDLISSNGDFFSITDASVLDSMSEISVQMWINIDTINVSGPNMLYSKRSTTNNGYVGFFSNTAWTFRLGTGTGTGLTYSTAPTTGNWQQVVVTIGSLGSKMYINAIEVANSAYTGNSSNVNTSATLDLFNVNPRPQVGPVTMDGKVSIFKIYSGVLTPAEVTAEFDIYKSRYGL